jgi:hypothetical protein
LWDINALFTQAHDFIKRINYKMPHVRALDSTITRNTVSAGNDHKFATPPVRPRDNLCKKELQKRHLNQPKTFAPANNSSIMPLANGRAGITGLANQLEEE